MTIRKSAQVGMATKVCAACDFGMVVRTNSSSGENFLGCTRYPECKHTEPLPVDIMLRLSGAVTLPGFE